MATLRNRQIRGYDVAFNHDLKIWYAIPCNEHGEWIDDLIPLYAKTEKQIMDKINGKL